MRSSFWGSGGLVDVLAWFPWPGMVRGPWRSLLAAGCPAVWLEMACPSEGASGMVTVYVELFRLSCHTPRAQAN